MIASTHKIKGRRKIDTRSMRTDNGMVDTTTDRKATKDSTEKEDGREEDGKKRDRESGMETPPRPDHEGGNHQGNSEIAVNAKGGLPAANPQRKQGSLMQCGQTQYNSGIRSTLKWEEKCSRHPTTR